MLHSFTITVCACLYWGTGKKQSTNNYITFQNGSLTAIRVFYLNIYLSKLSVSTINSFWLLIKHNFRKQHMRRRKNSAYRILLKLSINHFTTKTWAYSKEFYFFRKNNFDKKRLPPSAKSLIKNSIVSKLFNLMNTFLFFVC